MNPLDNVERLAQRFVEGTFHRFFGKKLHTVDLADQLLASIEAGRNGHEGNLIAASYRITVNPADYMALVQQKSIEEITSELDAFLIAFVDESAVQFDGPLQIVFNQDESVQPGRVEISTPYKNIDRGSP